MNVEEKIRPVTVVVRDHDFSQIGRTADSHHYLTTDEIINIYEELVRDFAHNEDPINPAGVKDMKVLESAVFHPQTSYRGILKYPTIETAAAALMYAVTHNHPFFNGNKRTSMVAMLVFLDRHNISVTCSEDDLFRISIELAKHRLVSPERLYPDSEIDALAHWLHSNSKYIQKGERPISVRKFKQILAHFNCEILPDGRVQRSIPTKDILGFSSVKILTTRLARIEPGTEGRQMNRLLIKSIREELRMTHQYGIDSEQFYEMANPTVADFIHEYKKVLGRLAKI
ncbi:MAG: type II toxin-antitoxin system death-on-curing family toxin [Bacillota bacterium]